MPFNLGMGEIILVFAIILLFFGAKRIPEIAGSFGKGIKEFKKGMNEVQRSIAEPDGGNERLGPPPATADKAVAAADETREPKKLIG
jgi:sec-independent protein translocase protein TatA